MGLSVYTFSVNSDGSMGKLLKENPWESPDWMTITEAERMKRFLATKPGRIYAGSETWRHEVWGADVMQSLGLVLLPSLLHHNFHVSGQDLDKLASEVATIYNNLPDVERRTGYSADKIAVCLSNINAAIKDAKEVGGGVVIM